MTQKFQDLVHYVIWKCEDPTRLGATKLNKIPWIVDTLAYELDGAGLTGETYIKRQHGPVPKNILRAIDTLVREGRIVVREPTEKYKPREFIALKAPDMSAFSPQNIALINSAIEAVCDRHTASSISLASHTQIWEAAEMGEELPLFTVFACEPSAITEADMQWADKVLDRVSVKA